MSAANLIVDNHGRHYQQGADSSHDSYSDSFNDKLNDSAKQALSGLAANLSQYSKQDKIFVRILIALVIVYLAIAVIVPFIETVEQTRELKEQVPPQLTRVVLARKQKPKPAPVLEPKKVEEKKPELKQEPKKPKPEPVAKPKQPLTKRQAAKQKAQSSGLAAMKDELLAMREVLVTAPVASKQLAKGERDQNRAQRKLLAAKADQQSVQLAKAKVSQTVSSDALSSHSSQRIRLSEQEVLASGDGEAKYADAANTRQADNLRSELSIRQTLEASKARLYALYNRALRKDPLLQGKVVFNIEIQPSGEISQVDIAVSELNNAKLERQLLVILRSINFGQEDVDVMATAWSIEFLPR